MRRFKMVLVAAMLLGSLVLGATAQAAPSYTTLKLPELDTNISTWSDGATYNSIFLGPQPQTWNDVPFKLAVDPANGNKVYYGLQPLTISVGVYGVTNVYTLINSDCGSYGSTIGKVEFYGTNNAYYSVNLVEGVYVRDHYAGYYNNVINGVDAMAAFDNGAWRARLDMQVYSLPADFYDETLTSIVFTGYDMGSAGRPFIAGATVASAVPLPSALFLFAPGLAGLAAIRRKFRK